MFERYTERARRVLFFARYEASELGSTSIEPEHLMLGLIREGKGLTTRIFAHWQLSLDSIRKEMDGRIDSRDKIPTSVEIPFSPSAKHVLQFAVEEADTLRHRSITTEHLLLGILRDERSVAGTILKEHGMQVDAVRQQIVRLLNEHPSMAGDAPAAASDPLKILAEENAKLRAVIGELEKGRELPVQFRDNAYWLHREGRSPEGPYCSTCWDVDRRLVRKLTDVLGNLYCEYCTRYRLQS